ncbi:MAG: type IV pilus biogenesis/stability protein PilW [Betaproteobacteria bacterium]
MKRQFNLLLTAMLLIFAGTAQAQQPSYEQGGTQINVPQGSQGSDPTTRAKIHTELASLYFQDGNMAVALEELRIAQAADPRYAPAYSVRGLVHAYLKENELAEAQFRRALELTPNDPQVNNNYGWFLCQVGKERQSIAYFLNAIKSPLYETPDLAYANAGRCAFAAGDLEGAEAYLQQAIRLSRDGGFSPRIQLAALQYKRGNLEEARRQINGVLNAMGQPTAEALWLALRVERKLGNRAAESTMAAQLRNRFPNSREYQEFIKGNFE